MSIESEQLLLDLKGELAPLVDDLRARCEEHPDVDAVVRAEWDEATRRGRTSRSYSVWRDDHLTNVAVAWLLALVFVRFCEDNDLVLPTLLGGSGDRRAVARGHRQLYFSEHPGHGDREWLLEVSTGLVVFRVWSMSWVRTARCGRWARRPMVPDG